MISHTRITVNFPLRVPSLSIFALNAAWLRRTVLSACGELVLFGTSTVLYMECLGHVLSCNTDTYTRGVSVCTSTRAGAFIRAADAALLLILLVFNARLKGFASWLAASCKP